MNVHLRSTLYGLGVIGIAAICIAVFGWLLYAWPWVVGILLLLGIAWGIGSVITAIVNDVDENYL